jgi:hypothetical protein
LDVIRLERGLTDYGKILRSLAKDVRLVTDALPTAITKTRREFSFTVELRGAGPNGQQSVQHVTVSTDQPGLTPREITDKALELGVSGADRYGLDVESATVLRGTRSGTAGTFQ